MSKLIPLTQGQFAIVDDDMSDYLLQWKWHLTNNGRAARFEKIPKEQRTNNRRQQVILMHRVVLGAASDMEVDHKNRNPLDNQRHNLRLATSYQNRLNRSKSTGTSSKYIGVCFYKKINRWGAYISINSKRVHLGCFLTEIEAAKARDNAARKYYGDFAALNLPKEHIDVTS